MRGQHEAQYEEAQQTDFNEMYKRTPLHAEDTTETRACVIPAVRSGSPQLPFKCVADYLLVAFYGKGAHSFEQEKQHLDEHCLSTSRKRRYRMPKHQNEERYTEEEKQCVKYIQAFIDVLMNEKDLQANIKKNAALKDLFAKKQWAWGSGFLYKAAKQRIKSTRERLKRNATGPRVCLL